MTDRPLGPEPYLTPERSAAQVAALNERLRAADMPEIATASCGCVGAAYDAHDIACAAEGQPDPSQEPPGPELLEMQNIANGYLLRFRQQVYMGADQIGIALTNELRLEGLIRSNQSVKVSVEGIGVQVNVFDDRPSGEEQA